MPILSTPDYSPPFPFTSGHLQTIYPTLFRRRPAAAPVRERLETDDGDFIDLDWHRGRDTSGNAGRGGRLAVISHGLEGNARRKNVLGMAAALCGDGWDVLCYSFRGCADEMNRLPRLYHSGATDDLDRVLRHGLATADYDCAALVGFSMGGNQTLKYLGENPSVVPRAVKAAAVFSVPVDLAGAARRMAEPPNRLYTRYFLRSLRRKVRLKARQYPEIFPTEGLDRLKTFFAFDDRYTGPVHGFAGAADYYARASASRFLTAITIPTLLVQAEDDPFLPSSCYPRAAAYANGFLSLEIPRYGGHVGFVERPLAGRYWSERRALQFLGEAVGLRSRAERGCSVLSRS